MFDILTIKDIVFELRGAIERTSFDNSDGNLIRFPHDCCQHAAILTAIHLSAWRFPNTVVVTAERDEPSADRHCWLRIGALDVDMTADQFGQDKVIVADCSAWHQLWRALPEETLRVDWAFKVNAEEWYMPKYNRILPKIKSNTDYLTHSAPCPTSYAELHRRQKGEVA